MNGKRRKDNKPASLILAMILVLPIKNPVSPEFKIGDSTLLLAAVFLVCFGLAEYIAKYL